MLRYSKFSNEVKEYANGANVLHLSPDRIRDYSIIVPTDEYQKQYDNLINSVIELIDCLCDKNKKLKSTRNILLPKLISGEIDVSEMDIKIKELENAA